ncbi:MAG: RNA polymerase sigma-70 factor [Bacteroidia bacterium]|nr:RNA polymerase sigma-70 factor [Bacteroidia bacterium]
MKKSIQFEKLYKRFQPSLINYAYYLTRSSEDSVELVNDVFLSVWNKKNRLKLDSNLKTYLYTAVKNRSINYIKKNKLVTVFDEKLDTLSDFETDHSLLEKEQDIIIQQIMNDLPSKCKQVFAMSRIDQLSNKEIASLLDISIKTVEAQITKALKIFRKKLINE